MHAEIADVRKSGELATLLHLERPRAAGLVTYAGGGLLLVAFVYMIVADTENVSHGKGAIRPNGNLVEVDAPLAGRVAEVLVDEGTRVEAGAPMIRLANPDVDLAVQVKRQSLRLAGERAHALIEQVEAQVRADLSVASAECGGLRSELDGLRRLERVGAVSPSEVRAKQADVSACVGRASPGSLRKKQIEAARRRVEVIVGEAGEPPPAEENTDPQVASALAEIEVLAAELRAAEAKRLELVIAAPSTGVVTRLEVRHAGEVVAAGAPLVELAPVGSDIVFEAFVPNGEIGEVRVGQAAIVKLDAYPHHEFGVVAARVTRIFPDAELRDERYGFRVILSVEATRRFPLRIGLSGTAEIVTGRQSLWSYLLVGRRG